MRPRDRDVTSKRRRRDQEIPETTIETARRGGVRFFIQVRYDGDGRAGRFLSYS